MLFWLLSAFIFGFATPYMARRFAKFMPATFAGAIVELLRFEKKNPAIYKHRLYKAFRNRSWLFAILNLCITALAIFLFPISGMLIVYMWLLLLLAEIDIKTLLLPDILTIPLLLLGIFASYANFGIVPIQSSVLGALIGYFLPVLVCLAIVWYKKDAFGGGDIKLLSAIGAWLGVEGLFYVITLAAILGLIVAWLSKKKNLAFGPMLAISGIITLFMYLQ